jgi:L-erythrulose 1-phosphate isomerase
VDDRAFWLGTSWKMTKQPRSAAEFVGRLVRRWPGYTDRMRLFVLPSHTLLPDVAARLAGSPVLVGAQDVHPAEPGAHTGGVSVEMIRAAGAQLVEVGHSERRREHGETDADVRLKVGAALAGGLRPLVCVGEPRSVREAGTAVPYVTAQVLAACAGLTVDQLDRVLIAYEPVWAIGAGATPATLDQLESVHAAVLDALRSVGAARPSVLYGGSVHPGNAAELAASPVVHGLFVGRHAWPIDGFLDLADRVHAVLRPSTGPTPATVAARARTAGPTTPRQVSRPRWRRLLDESGLLVGLVADPRAPVSLPRRTAEAVSLVVTSAGTDPAELRTTPRGAGLILDVTATATDAVEAARHAARLGADGLRLRWDHHEAAQVHALAEQCHEVGMLLLVELRARATHARSLAEQVGQVAAAGADLLLLPVPARRDGDDDGILAYRALDAAAGPVPWIPRLTSEAYDRGGADELAMACQAGANGVLLDHRSVHDRPPGQLDAAVATLAAFGRPISLATPVATDASSTEHALAIDAG